MMNGNNRASQSSPRRKKASRKKRSDRGNMIALLAAITLGLVLALLIFALRFTRFLGSNQEQKTAVEAAALAAANDVSRITIDDPNFGLIALSDFAPIGFDTAAADKQPTPVRGINTIMGTVRVDMIIADQLNNAEMQQLAQLDYNNARTAVNNLKAALQDAVLAKPAHGPYYDWDGNVVNVNADAVAAYQKNVNRMTGVPTSLDSNSMLIQLGQLVSVASTNTAIPQPSQFSNTTSDQTRQDTFPNGTVNTCYGSYINIPYKSKTGQSYDFVFGGVDNSLKIVDLKQWSNQQGNLPYSLPTIVRAQANQVYKNQDGSDTSVMNAACAQPASAGDPRPFPGAMVVGFPNGRFPELTTFNDILGKPILAKIPFQIDTPGSGDTGPDIPYPGVNQPSLGGTGGLGGYHWYRRGGHKVNVSGVVSALSNVMPSLGQASAAQMVIFTIDVNGNVTVTAQAENPARMVLTSEHQLTGRGNALFKTASGTTYGVVFSDVVAFPGRMYGGRHAGEPLLGAGVANAWNASTTTGESITAIGGLLAWVTGLLSLLITIIGVLLATVTSLLFGPAVFPPAMWTPITSAHTAAPPPATPRTPRDTYTQQGMAVDIEFPKVP